MYVVACYISGGTLYMSFATDITRQDTWLAVITGFLLCAFFAWIILLVSKEFPGKTLFDINDIVFGKIAGRIITGAYLFYFFINTCLDIREVGNFITNYIMSMTPMIPIIFLFTASCAYAVHKGLPAILRNGFLFASLIIITIIIDSIFLMPEMNFDRFTPLFTRPFGDYVQATLNTAVIPFDGLIALPVILPYFQKIKNHKKSVFWGIFIGAVAIMIVVIRDWAVLGNTSLYAAIPSFQAVRLVKLGKVFTRVEILIAAILVTIRFFRCSILYYCFAKGVEHLLGLQSYKPLSGVLAIIMVCASNCLYCSLAEGGYFGTYIGAYYIIFFVFILPVITLAFIKLRHKNNTKRT